MYTNISFTDDARFFNELGNLTEIKENLDAFVTLRPDDQYTTWVAIEWYVNGKRHESRYRYHHSEVDGEVNHKWQQFDRPIERS